MKMYIYQYSECTSFSKSLCEPKCTVFLKYYRAVQSHPMAGWLWTPSKCQNKKCFNNDRALLSRGVLDFVGAPIIKLWNPSKYIYFLVGIKKTKKSVQSHPVWRGDFGHFFCFFNAHQKVYIFWWVSYLYNRGTYEV